MENKNVGWLIIGICIIIVIIIVLFNKTTMESVKNSCYIQHGYTESCEMFDSVNNQTYLSLAIVGVIFILGIIFIFSKPREKIIIRKVKESIKLTAVDLSGFNTEEKQVFNMVRKHGAIFQAEIIEKLGLGKAKITRVLDRLEGNGLVERKRRGMTNVVVLKEGINLKE